MKKIFVFCAILLLVSSIVYVILPHHRDINIQVPAVKYSQNNLSQCVNTEVDIIGQYTKKIGQKDRFIGQLVIQGQDHLKNYSLDISIDATNGSLLRYVQFVKGDMNIVDLGYIYSLPEFSQFAILVLDHPEMQSGVQTWSREDGIIICAPAKNLNEAEKIAENFIF